jgi:hypothetical protein
MRNVKSPTRNASADTNANVEQQNAARERRWLRRRDVVAEFGISARTVGNWTARRLVPYRKIGRVILFERSEIVSALDRYRVSAIGEQTGGRR